MDLSPFGALTFLVGIRKELLETQFVIGWRFSIGGTVKAIEPAALVTEIVSQVTESARAYSYMLSKELQKFSLYFSLWWLSKNVLAFNNVP